MSTIIKPLANTININTTANDIYKATVVKVVNDGVTATLVFKYANNVQYGEIPLANGESVVVQKGSTDLLIGANMFAAPIAYPKG